MMSYPLKNWSLGGLMLGIITAGILFAWSSKSHDEKPQSLFKPEDRTIVELGQKLYATACAACHGADLEGQENWRQRNSDGSLRAPPHDEHGHTWHHTDDVLFGLTKLGAARFIGLESLKTSMPVFEGQLSDPEIIAILSFIKSRWPEEIRKRHDQMNAAHANANK